MNNISYARALRAVRRAVFFSFITAPSLTLFVAFGFLSFNNSLAGAFLDEARSLVADAPPGKVWDCAPQGTPTEINLPPVPAVKPVCEPVLVDASAWQQSTDFLIRHVYLWVVMMGALMWWLFNGCQGIEGTGHWLKKKSGKIKSILRGE